MGIQYNYFHLRAKQCSTFFYRYVNVIEILTYTRGYYLTFHGMRKYKHWYFTIRSYLSAIFCYSLIHIYIYIFSILTTYNKPIYIDKTPSFDQLQ